MCVCCHVCQYVLYNCGHQDGTASSTTTMSYTIYVHTLSHAYNIHAYAGLDAATSKDILTVLNRLTQTGCSVLLTIHQPRIEIFHMFHKIVLFTEGQVAYFGSPFKAISYFTEKLQQRGMHFKVRTLVYVYTYICTYSMYVCM